MRRDLPRGLQAANLIHAAGESSHGALPPNTRAVALWTDDPTLAQLERKLLDAQIPHTAIREPEAPWNGALMAIGIAPCERETLKPLRDVLPQLPLVR